METDEDPLGALRFAIWNALLVITALAVTCCYG